MKKYKRFLYVIVMVVVVSITVGYASFCSDMSISNIVADIRLTKDARVTAFAYSSATGSATTSYTNYNKKTLLTDITLPSSSSTITYKVTVTNFGNVDMGIYELTGLPSNLTYSVTDYILQDKICDSSNNCTLGANKTFYVTIKYATNGYNSSSTSYSLKVGVDFRQFYTISYDNGITNNNYPSSIISGGNLNVTFGDNAPASISIYINGALAEKSNYSYINGVLIYNNVNGNLVIEASKKLSNVVFTSNSDSSVDFSVETSTAGKYVMSGTENDENPIYYYRGNVTDNNVLFANFCWKIVRTTSTGGTKLIYNGVPASDGSCDNTGVASLLTTSAYNDPAAIGSEGYMYGELYTISSNSFSSTTSTAVNVLNRPSSTLTNVYYASSVSYNSSTSLYSLNNATKINWKEHIDSLTGQYTCNSSSLNCSTVNYTAGFDGQWPIWLKLTGGEDVNDHYIIIGKNYNTNSDGTNTLTNTIKILKKDWPNNYSSYVGYYMCPSLDAVTCDKAYNIAETNIYQIKYIDLTSVVPIIYGNDVSYNNGVYTLTDTYTAKTEWAYDYKNIAKKYHYTCFNTSGICSEVYYIIDFLKSKANYITLTNGDDIEDAKLKIYSNENDSVIKGIIDSWYESNMTTYTSMLEDAIWCNDRSFASGSSLIGKDEDASIGDGYTYYNIYNYISSMEPNLSCPNQSDSFTVNVANGNGNLKYPVGLLNLSELILSGHILGLAGLFDGTFQNYPTYLNSNVLWTISPTQPSGNVVLTDSMGIFMSATDDTSVGVSPSIVLKNGITFSGGDGSVTTPYIVE